MSSNRVKNVTNGNMNGQPKAQPNGLSPLELLVQDLAKQTVRLTDYLQANKLPEASFERDAPIINLSPQAPAEIQVAKEKLQENALQIFQLVAGPGEYLQNVITGVSSDAPVVSYWLRDTDGLDC